MLITPITTTTYLFVAETLNFITISSLHFLLILATITMLIL